MYTRKCKRIGGKKKSIGRWWKDPFFFPWCSAFLLFSFFRRRESAAGFDHSSHFFAQDFLASSSSRHFIGGSQLVRMDGQKVQVRFGMDSLVLIGQNFKWRPITQFLEYHFFHAKVPIPDSFLPVTSNRSTAKCPCAVNS